MSSTIQRRRAVGVVVPDAEYAQAPGLAERDHVALTPRERRARW
jgi:hypothetical protein